MDIRLIAPLSSEEDDSFTWLTRLLSANPLYCFLPCEVWRPNLADLLEVSWHLLSKWFIFPHSLQSFPQAGHFSFSIGWLNEPNLHSFVLSRCLPSRTLLTLSDTRASPCEAAVSPALQMCIHLSMARCLTFSSFSLMSLLRIPIIIRSRSVEDSHLGLYWQVNGFSSIFWDQPETYPWIHIPVADVYQTCIFPVFREFLRSFICPCRKIKSIQSLQRIISEAVV